MTSRRDARRHRGRNRPHPRRAPTIRAPRTISADEVPDHSARAALGYWFSALDGPLFVYFIQARSGGPVKIGQAIDPIARLRDLQCGTPELLVIQALVLANVDTEGLIHDHWRLVAQVRGEWFGRGHGRTLIRLAREAARQQVGAHRRGAELYPVTCMAAEMVNVRGWGLEGFE